MSSEREVIHNGEKKRIKAIRTARGEWVVMPDQNTVPAETLKGFNTEKEALDAEEARLKAASSKNKK